MPGKSRGPPPNRGFAAAKPLFPRLGTGPSGIKSVEPMTFTRPPGHILRR